MSEKRNPASDIRQKPKAAEFKSGYVAILGRPNVGKSTLLNAILGQKVSIVTSKPQTTRNRIIGIKNLKDAQIIFVDTPGIHRPMHKLGALIVKAAKSAIKDVDAIALIVEPMLPGETERHIIKILSSTETPVFLLINKIDSVKKQALLPVIEAYKDMREFKGIIPISALKGDGLDLVLDSLRGVLPEGPKFYPDDLVTDQIERFMAAEFIREKIMEATEEELPHSVAVEIVRWNERPDGLIEISADIYVEKDGQKAIIIGKGGSRLKNIGTSARADIESLLGAKVFLELWVKVKRRWRMSDAALSELGYK